MFILGIYLIYCSAKAPYFDSCRLHTSPASCKTWVKCVFASNSVVAKTLCGNILFPVPVISIPIPVLRLSSPGTRFQIRFWDSGLFFVRFGWNSIFLKIQKLDFFYLKLDFLLWNSIFRQFCASPIIHRFEIKLEKITGDLFFVLVLYWLPFVGSFKQNGCNAI